MHQPKPIYSISSVTTRVQNAQGKDFRFGSCNRYGHEFVVRRRFGGEQTRNAEVFIDRTQGALIVEVEVGPVASIKVSDDKYIAKVVTDVVGDEL